MRNRLESGTLMAGVQGALRQRLPAGWSLEVRGGSSPSLRVRAPDRRVAVLPALVRRGLVPRDVAALLAAADGPVLVVAPFLGARARQLISAAGSSYADATGNLRLVIERPAVFLEAAGSQRDPDRKPRPLQSLRGPAAGRVVRGLLELALPLRVRELAGASGTPLGTVSRVVSFLESEVLLERNAQRQVVTVDRARLVSRWAEDYELTRSNDLQTFLDPRGLDGLWKKLQHLDRYAATGTVAGPGIAPPRIAVLYVDDPESAARVLGLVPAEAGANVWLLHPYDDVVFERTDTRSLRSGEAEIEVTIVAPAQAAVDLLGSPGRGPSEAEVLLARWANAVRESPDAE